MTPERVTDDVGERPLVVFAEVRDDLEVEGWDQTTVAVSMAEGEPAVEHDVGTVRLHLGGAAKVRVPAAASLQLAEVEGSLTVRRVAGAIHADTVAGDATVDGVGPTAIQAVAGDLAARDVAGDLRVGQVGGRAAVDGVAGSVPDLTVGADLALRGVRGDVKARVGARASLQLEPTTGQRTTVVAGADVRCQVPPDAGLEIAVVSGAGVRSDLGDGPPGRTWRTTLGDGGATLSLTAGARVWLTSGTDGGDDKAWQARPGTGREERDTEFMEDIGRWAEDFSERMRSQAATMAEQMADRLGRVAETLPDVLVAAGMSADEADRIAMRVRRSAERAGEKLEHTMRDVGARMERTAADVERRAARLAERHAAREASRHASHKSGPGGRRGRKHAAWGGGRVSEEERTKILRMVEEGKISVEQASRLLAALEGRPE